MTDQEEQGDSPSSSESCRPSQGVADPDETTVSEQDDRSDVAAEPHPDPQTGLQAQRDELEAQLLRVSADYQNFVRRSQQNIHDACQQQLLGLAKALLTPLDHFDRALDLDPEKTTTDSLVKGVQMVRDELMKVLDQFGVKRLEVSAGDSFDPVCHEALQRMPVEGLDSGAVAQQLQPGYLLGDKTLRPAKVIVVE